MIRNDRDFGFVRVVWDVVNWANTNIVYIINVSDATAGHIGDRFYTVYHPNNFLYTYARWGHKIHVEVYAADKVTSRLSRIIAKDFKMQDRPASAVNNNDYPANDTPAGLNAFGGYPTSKLIRYKISWPVDDNTWMDAQTTLTGAVPFNTESTFLTVREDGNFFYVNLPEGAIIHQETSILYPHIPDPFTQTVIKDFTVGTQF